MNKGELNMALVEASGMFDSYDEIELEQNGVVIARKYPVSAWGLAGAFNYETWNDLMPLVVKHGVGLAQPYKKGGNFFACFWNHETGYAEFEIANPDPKRALAECLLKVLQEEGE